MRQAMASLHNRGFLLMGFGQIMSKCSPPLESNGLCQAASFGLTVAVGSTEVMLDD